MNPRDLKLRHQIRQQRDHYEQQVKFWQFHIEWCDQFTGLLNELEAKDFKHLEELQKKDQRISELRELVENHLIQTTGEKKKAIEFPDLPQRDIDQYGTWTYKLGFPGGPDSNGAPPTPAR